MYGEKAQKVKLNSTEFQPKKENILVKPEELEQEEKTESGLVISLKARSYERPTSGVIIGKGKDIEDLEEGTFVIWPQTDGIDIEFNDGIFILLRYESILGSKK